MPNSRSPWKPRLRGRTGPIYLAIADALAEDLQAGRVVAGERLPTQRALAAALDVDLTTVTRAFAEARRRGLIEAVVGRGTFVRSLSLTAAEAHRSPIDMTMNLPPQPAQAALRERVQAGLAAVVARPDFMSLLTYRGSAGADEDRLAGAAWLQTRLGAISTERLLVASGAQAATLAVVSTLARPGDLILAEALTYPGLRALATHLGIRLAGLALDAEGIRPDAFEAACRRDRPKALYTIPTLHNPTTATMSEARRRKIAAIAERHEIPIIEDDAYGLLARDAPLPLASLAPRLTYYIGSLAKVLTPALRVAYLVAPDERHAGRLAAALRAVSMMSAPLMVALATGWIEDGTAAEILAALRREAMLRQRLARAMLPADRIQSHPDSHHLWLSLPPAWQREAFVSHLRQQSLAVVSSDAFTIAGTPPEALRLCLGAAVDQDALRHALAILGDALAHRPEAVMPIVV